MKSPFAPPESDAADAPRMPWTIGAALVVFVLLAAWHARAARYVPLVAWIADAPSLLVALAAAGLLARRRLAWWLAAAIAALSTALSAVAVVAADAEPRRHLYAAIVHVLYDGVELAGGAAALVLLALPASRRHFHARRRD